MMMMPFPFFSAGCTAYRWSAILGPIDEREKEKEREQQKESITKFC